MTIANIEHPDIPPNGEVLGVGDAESHLRDWPAAVRAQGKRLLETFPIGGAMRYRPV